MTRPVDLAVRLLAATATERLCAAKNVAKGPWDAMPPETLLRMAQDEIDEALHALRTGKSRADVLQEIGDVGAFVAMAAERVYARHPTGNG